MSPDTETKVGTDGANDGVADIMCTLVVGEERQEFLVKKDYLMDIEYFKCALKDGCWKEGKDNRIELPEDDPELWEIAIEFIMTNEYLPRVLPTCDCIIGETWCHDPKFDPPVQVIGADDVVADFNIEDDQVGDWGYPDTTLAILENLVGLFCLANKYLWPELLSSCMERLRLFPMGPAALPLLSVTVGEREWGLVSDECWDEGLCDEFHELVRDAFRYHTVRYDTAPVHTRISLEKNWREVPKPYEPLKDFFKANMTEEAWKAFTLLEDYRQEQKVKLRCAMDAHYWECNQERQGVCILAWDRQAYDIARPKYLKQKENAWLEGCERDASQTFWRTHNETCFCENKAIDGRTEHQFLKEHHARMKDASNKFLRLMEEKLVPKGNGLADASDTQQFAEADIADLITDIKDDALGGRYVTGLVHRTNKRGWFPRSALRLFEQRSRKHCNGSCCEARTFKYDGRTLYLDDPLDEGIKPRKGKKSGGSQRTGRPRRAEHERTVAGVLRFKDGSELDSDSLPWLQDSLW
ncbi:hypothetical protein MMC11_001276 [Xylographa trunciseda]|nr:hypothetical protein [Xylographa trunciseda]